MSVADKYEYTIRWCPEEQEFYGVSTEWEYLTAGGDTPEEALRAIRELVRDCVRDLEEKGEPVPVPFALRAKAQA